ncbi:PaaI family thioesterase [Saccharopolyspora elongata]|uniref:PaaI family thioesterase n=1 Tax=Saccharopolyspora elongata TaxID=2530387 RepID=A0A4R4YE98_9PSEU|nr:PaaI family thioesterase [Saccharopolyspora elongata]TDD42936.1 PaaI family thioesterase [Saccharopolyspora elongata]
MTAIDHQQLVALMPFAVSLGVQIDSASADEVRGHLDWAPQRCTAGGVLHGGAVMALADSIGAICAFLNLPEGAHTATIESKTNFFRALREGALHAVSRPLHVGRTNIAVQTELLDLDGRRVGHTTQTQAVLTA